jgi:hypothetical protein
MEQLLLLALPDMLVVVWDLVPCLFLPGVVALQRLVKQLVIDLLQILVDKDDVLPRPVPVYIGRRELPVIVPDASPAHHAGNRCSDTSHPSFPLPCFSVFVLLSFYHTSTD